MSHRHISAERAVIWITLRSGSPFIPVSGRRAARLQEICTSVSMGGVEAGLRLSHLGTARRRRAASIGTRLRGVYHNKLQAEKFEG